MADRIDDLAERVTAVEIDTQSKARLRQGFGAASTAPGLRRGKLRGLNSPMRRYLLVLALLASAVASLAADTWPHWRGPSMDGVSPEKGLPTTWSATENVAWKLPLPAFSGSTPIVWNDTIFLNVATERGTGQIELWAVDRNTRAVAWKRQLAGENRIGRKQNMSSPSPVTDGKQVWAITGTGIMK